jgi:hypothetical protein
MSGGAGHFVRLARRKVSSGSKQVVDNLRKLTHAIGDVTLAKIKTNESVTQGCQPCVSNRIGQIDLRPLPRWAIKEIRNSTRKTTNSNFAMPAAATAMPVKPKTPAMSATTKNTNAQ